AVVAVRPQGWPRGGICDSREVGIAHLAIRIPSDEHDTALVYCHSPGFLISELRPVEPVRPQRQAGGRIGDCRVLEEEKAVAVRTSRRTGYKPPAIPVNRDCVSAILAVPRPVVAVGPECHARRRVLDRQIIITAPVADGRSCHKYVATRVHSY